MYTTTGRLLTHAEVLAKISIQLSLKVYGRVLERFPARVWGCPLDQNYDDPDQELNHVHRQFYVYNSNYNIVPASKQASKHQSLALSLA